MCPIQFHYIREWEAAIMLGESFTSTGLSIIFALATNITALTVHTSGISYIALMSIFFQPTHSFVGKICLNWHGQPLLLLSRKLEELTITDDSCDRTNYRYSNLPLMRRTPMLRSNRFENLKRLTVPVECIVPSPWFFSQYFAIFERPHLCKELPESLERLNLRIPYQGMREQHGLVGEGWVANFNDCNCWGGCRIGVSWRGGDGLRFHGGKGEI